MKKLLVATLLACGIAHANSAELYGSLDYSLRYDNHANNTNDSGRVKQYSGIPSPTYFGIRGEEQLNASQSIKFKLESGFSLVSGQTAQTGGTANTDTLFDRAAWVGFSDKTFGEFQLGRNTNAPMDLATSGVSDPLKLTHDGNGAPVVVGNATYGVGAMRVDQALTFVGSSSGLRNSRSDGMIKYTNKFGNVDVALTYAPGGTTGDMGQKRSYSGSAVYTSGPLKLAAANFTAEDAANKTETSNTIAANYTIGDFTVTGSHFSMNTDAGYVPANLTIGATPTGPVLGLTTTSGPSTHGTLNLVGIKYQQTPALVHTFVINNGKYENGVGSSGKLKTQIVMSEYYMTKRTNVYAILDHSAATGSLVYNTSSTNTAVTFGIRHRF